MRAHSAEAEAPTGDAATGSASSLEESEGWEESESPSEDHSDYTPSAKRPNQISEEEQTQKRHKKYATAKQSKTVAKGETAAKSSAVAKGETVAKSKAVAKGKGRAS